MHHSTPGAQNSVWHTVGPQRIFVKYINRGAWRATLIHAPEGLLGDL